MCHNSATKMRQNIMDVADALLSKTPGISISVEDIQKGFEKETRLVVAGTFIQDTLSANTKRYILEYDNEENLKILSRNF